MGLEVGLVGLPNVGKSTLFRAITASQSAEAANYPFCTIDPNVGVVDVPDLRLDRLQELYSPQKLIPNILSLIDIAGLVKGASQGEGLGNTFLNHIRQVDAIIHLVRCFEDDKVIHVDGSVNPLRDIEVIHTELILADLEQVERKCERTRKQSKGNKSAASELELYEDLIVLLSDGVPARNFEQVHDPHIQALNLITAKPFFYVLNVAEEQLSVAGETCADAMTEAEAAVRALAEKEQVSVIKMCCELESELAAMEKEERAEFLAELGVGYSGLDLVVREGFAALNQISFFTAGKTEVRAWNLLKGETAPCAAGKIHTDMQRGFIRCEVFGYDDLDQLGSEQAVKDKGKLRVEGKDYIICDGDIIHVRFAV